MLFFARFRFAAYYAVRHLFISVLIAIASAGIVFGLWYVAPYWQMLEVGRIYLLVLVVDVICGPLLTLILTSPRKSCRERWIDFSLIGIIQLCALAYGTISVWGGRPVVLSFEGDRLVVVTANEVVVDALPKAPMGFQHMPWAGVLEVGIRKAANNEEAMSSLSKELEGVSPSMRPDWWLPRHEVLESLRFIAKPLAELINRRPADVRVLQDAAARTGSAIDQLTYLPLVTSKNLDWVALFDHDLNMVGWAPVDGF